MFLSSPGSSPIRSFSSSPSLFIEGSLDRLLDDLDRANFEGLYSFLPPLVLENSTLLEFFSLSFSALSVGSDSLECLIDTAEDFSKKYPQWSHVMTMPIGPVSLLQLLVLREEASLVYECLQSRILKLDPATLEQCFLTLLETIIEPSSDLSYPNFSECDELYSMLDDFLNRGVFVDLETLDAILRGYSPNSATPCITLLFEHPSFYLTTVTPPLLGSLLSGAFLSKNSCIVQAIWDRAVEQCPDRLKEARDQLLFTKSFSEKMQYMYMLIRAPRGGSRRGMFRIPKNFDWILQALPQDNGVLILSNMKMKAFSKIVHLLFQEASFTPCHERSISLLLSSAQGQKLLDFIRSGFVDPIRSLIQNPLTTDGMQYALNTYPDLIKAALERFYATQAVITSLSLVQQTRLRYLIAQHPQIHRTGQEPSILPSGAAPIAFSANSLKRKLPDYDASQNARHPIVKKTLPTI